MLPEVTGSIPHPYPVGNGGGIAGHAGFSWMKKGPPGRYREAPIGDN